MSNHDTGAIDSPPRSEQGGNAGSPAPAERGQKSDAERAGAKDPSRTRTGASDAGDGSGGSTHAKTRRKVTEAPAGCPPNLTRKECASRVKAQVESEESRSYPVSSVKDCVEAMGEVRCREIISGQEAAMEAGGSHSIDPYTCLQEYSREFCEAQLREKYEQQQPAASAGQ